MSSSVIVKAILLCYVVASALAAWNTLSPSPNVSIKQVSQGTHTIWVMDYNGLFKYTQKSSISWQTASLPNNLVAQALSVGINDDACAIDQNYQLWCRKYGTTSWVQIPVPANDIVTVDIYSYANSAMVVGSYGGDAWLYVSGSWVKIADSSIQAIIALAIASDGTIAGLDSAGSYYSYSGTGTTWNLVNSGNNFYQLDSGVNSSTDVVVVSTNYPFVDYKKNGSTFSTFSNTISWLTVLNGVIYGTDTNNVLQWV